MAALLTITNFREEFNVSRSTVYRLKERGDIAFVYIGRAVRIRREDAARWYAGLSEAENDRA